MAPSDPLLQALCAAVVVVLVPLAVVIVRPTSRALLVAAFGAATLAAVSVVALDAQLGFRDDPPAALLDAAAAAAVTFCVTVFSAHRRGSLNPSVSAPLAGLQAALWGAAVIGPVLVATVGTVPALVQRSLGAVDGGGALATHVAPAAALFLLAALPSPSPSLRSLRSRSRTTANHDAATPDVRHETAPGPSRTRAAVAIVLLTIAAGSWLVGVERVVSEATGRLVANAAVGILFGVVSWLVIARIVGRGRPPAGPALGAVLGWAAVGAGAGFLGPLALVAAAVLGAGVGTAVALRVPTGADPVRRAAAAVIVSTAIGGLIATILADGFGLAASGATLGLLTQVLAVVIVAVASATVALVAWGVAWAAAWMVGMLTRSVPRES